jgi:phosphoglycerate dehydrogenase-like enzyme
LTKPKVIVTRKWPAQVEAELKKRFDVTLNESDRPLTKAELSAAMTQYDALCPTVSDQISGDVIGTKNSRVKLVANFGVGFNHIEHPGCFDRRHGGPCLQPDAFSGAAHFGRRAGATAGRLDGLAAHPYDGRAGYG